ncbi:MAG: ABC transporter substrate-binding protein, partial [Devosia sp. SCN 66-27]
MKLLKSLLGAAVIAGALGGSALAQDKVTIGVSVPAADHGWTGGVNYFAQQAIERLKKTYSNVDFVFASAPDAPKQIADIEDMVSTRNIDALVILPGDPDAMTSAIKQVKDAGKFVTVVDRQLSINGVENLYVAGDNPGLGANSAEYFKQALPEGGNIVILRGLPIPIDQQRFDAFVKGIEGTNIKVLDDEFANWNRDDGFKVMQDFLTRFPDIKAVWAQDDDIALGAIEAIKQAGRENDMFIVGGAGMQQMLQRVAA